MYVSTSPLQCEWEWDKKKKKKLKKRQGEGRTYEQFLAQFLGHLAGPGEADQGFLLEAETECGETLDVTLECTGGDVPGVGGVPIKR
jgi:hypothetical protein